MQKAWWGAVAALGVAMAAGFYLADVWHRPWHVQARHAWALQQPWYREAALSLVGLRGVVASEAPGQPCPAQHLAIAVLGQSNAANVVLRPHGLRRIPDGKTFMWDWVSGRCLPYAEPLAGTDGPAGNVITPVVAALRQRDPHTPVIVVAFARGGSSVFAWSHGIESVRLDKVLARLQAQGIRPAWFLWHQGETDAVPDTSLRHRVKAYGAEEGDVQALYARSLDMVLGKVHQAFPQARVGLARASVCMNGGSLDVRQAQQRVDERHDWVSLSSDTDRLGDAFRHDGCHFNEAGEALIAADYLRLLSTPP